MDLGGESTAWLIAVTGFVTGVGTLVLNRRGQKDQKTMQVAANAIAADKHRLEETQQALDALQQLLDRAIEDAQRWRGRAEEAETELDEQRDLHRAMYSQQESRCREYAQELTDVILMLRRVVIDEIAIAQATIVLGRDEHPHRDRQRPMVEARRIEEEQDDGDTDADHAGRV